MFSPLFYFGLRWRWQGLGYPILISGSGLAEHKEGRVSWPGAPSLLVSEFWLRIVWGKSRLWGNSFLALLWSKPSRWHDVVQPLQIHHRHNNQITRVICFPKMHLLGLCPFLWGKQTPTQQQSNCPCPSPLSSPAPWSHWHSGHIWPSPRPRFSQVWI